MDCRWRPSQIEQFRNNIKKDIPQLINFEKANIELYGGGALPPEGISTAFIKKFCTDYSFQI